MVAKLLLVGALIAACSSDCPRTQVPSRFAVPYMVLAGHGRVVAIWDQRKYGNRAEFRYVTNSTTSSRGLPLDNLDNGAIGTRSAMVLEATGKFGPRRAALLYDAEVRVIELDAPILTASVVFDGTQYQ